ncbi:MAG: DUF302 domain-containing protein [Acidobacteriota bacterium]
MITVTRDFSLSMQTTQPFDQCLAFLRQSLRQAGFRILAEVPFHREFERHVGLGCQNYTVLIVWSPFLAYQALLSDRDAGIFMPFHFIVAENGKSTLVAATNHALFGRASGKIGVQVLARDLTRKIRQIFSELAAREKSAPHTPLQPQRREVS